jgi:mannose-6-phosphate isomerase-like protein (cupin superfamily)
MKGNRDVSLTISDRIDVAFRIELRHRNRISLMYDDPEIVARNWVVNDSWTMRELIAHLDAVLASKAHGIVIPGRARRSEITYVKSDLSGFNMVVTLDVNGPLMEKKISEVIPRTGDRDEDLIDLEFFFTWVVSKENEIPFNQSRISCHHCGITPLKKKREKTGARRIFCHKDCQNRFYSGAFSVDIEKATKRNSNYRTVLYTTLTQQLVLMSITPEDLEIGGEIHPYTTQLIRVESGKGIAVVDGVSIQLKDGSLIVVNPGAKHNIINSDPEEPLKLYSVYSPPHHRPWTLHKRKSRI